MTIINIFYGRTQWKFSLDCSYFRIDDPDVYVVLKQGNFVLITTAELETLTFNDVRDAKRFGPAVRCASC